MKVPAVGESITEVTISTWLKKDGDYVEKDEEVAEVDSDKATLTINAEESGAVKLIAKEGDTVKVGQVVFSIDTSVKGESKKSEVISPKSLEKTEQKIVTEVKKNETKDSGLKTKYSYANGTPSPAAKKLIDENKIPVNKVVASGKDGRITKGDVLHVLANGFDSSSTAAWGGSRETDRTKMTSLRKKLAQRLVSVKNETAMPTLPPDAAANRKRTALSGRLRDLRPLPSCVDSNQKFDASCLKNCDQPADRPGKSVNQFW